MTWNKKTIITAIFIGVIVIGVGALITGIMIAQVPVIITGMVLIGVGGYSACMSSIRSN
jgi:uncharacterized membrane protein